MTKPSPRSNCNGFLALLDDRQILGLDDMPPWPVSPARSLSLAAFFDTLVLDALYAQTAVLDLAAEIGWDVLISLKHNPYDLYQSAVRLFAQRPADSSYTEQRDGKSYQVQLRIP